MPSYNTNMHTVFCDLVNLSMNFAARVCSSSLGSAKLKKAWHSLTTFMLEVLNIFIKNRSLTKSSESLSDLFRGQASSP